MFQFDLVFAILWVTAATGIIGLPIYLVFRFLRAYEARSGLAPDRGLLDARLAALEARIEALETENERLIEGQRFTAALLATQRPDASADATVPILRTDTPSAPDAIMSGEARRT